MPPVSGGSGLTDGSSSATPLFTPKPTQPYEIDVSHNNLQTSEPAPLGSTAAPALAEVQVTMFPSNSPTGPCGGPCDDGNLCTTDYCDIPTETCKTEPLICGDNEACDAFSGKCRNVQSVIPCVAVIDEWDNQDFTQEWEDFLRQYPQRPFCLLVPETRFDFDSLHRM